jgi:hypothetical protein
MAVEIPRFWAWIVANSPTEFRRDGELPRNDLNEGTPKKHFRFIAKKSLY